MIKRWILIGAALASFAAAAQHYESGDIHAMSPWSRALPPVSKNGATYVTLKNHADTVDRLVGASTPIADRVELHRHSMEDGVMKMGKVDSVDLEPGEYVTLEPGGYHLMLVGLKAPLKENDQFELILEFEHAVPLEVMVTVHAVDSAGPDMTHHEMQHQHESGE